MSRLEIPGYEILEKVAEGGMATVWKARQVSLDRIVALKVLSPGLIEDPEEIERFREEARAAARFHHPGLVQIYDAGENEGQVYYVMEYIDGDSIGQRLVREGAIPEGEALKIVGVAAAILNALWDRDKVIHCDIKPDNILIDEEGRVHITDLGLARAIGHATMSTEKDFIVGTPHYASPEQAQGMDDLDCRTDIYALGATLYHMLTGRLPFAEKSGMDAMDAQVADQLPDPQNFRPDISHGAAWLMEKMLLKDRSLRYQTWAEVRRDLAEVAQGRMPHGQLPVAGQSTLARTERRESATQAKLNAMRPARPRPADEDSATSRTVGSPVVTRKKRKVVVHKAGPAVGAAPRPKRPENTQQSLSTMLFLVILVGGLYGGVFFTIHRFAVMDTAAPPVAAEPRSEVARVPEPPPPREEFIRPTPPPERVEPPPRRRVPEPEPDPADDMPLDWDHPRYVEAMTLLKAADDAFQSFLESRDQSLLDEVEPRCRRAIQLFESVRDQAPARARIAERIRQCFQLISNSRQSRLLESRVAPEPSGTPDAAPPRRTPAELALAENWNAPVPGRIVTVHELNHLLSEHGQPGVDLSPRPGIRLFEHVSYLMPVEEALQRFGIDRPHRRPVVCPGFPEDSLYYYKVAGTFGDGFNRLLLVTDAEGQVVAVQLMSDTPRAATRLDGDRFAGKWRTYDFIQTRTKPHGDWEVGYLVEALSQGVRVDSELFNPKEGAGLSMARVSLYMPQPLVDLILRRLSG